MGIAREDVAGLKKAYRSYGPSWKRRGGANAWFMLCRKYDRMEIRLAQVQNDIFLGIATDTRGEGLIDDVRDLRRYLMLVEAEMRARGFQRTHRDNKKGGDPMAKSTKGKPAPKKPKAGKGSKC